MFERGEIHKDGDGHEVGPVEEVMKPLGTKRRAIKLSKGGRPAAEHKES